MELYKLWQGNILITFLSLLILKQLLYQIGHNKHNLSRHVLRHLEEGKTFPCNFCGKESRSSNGLNQHIVKRHPTESVRPDFDQKSQEFGAALDEKDVEDAFDHKREELEKEEDSLEIDLDDAEEGDDPVQNEVNDDEDGSAGQSRKETTEDFKEKIEAMIEKVSTGENSNFSSICSPSRREVSGVALSATRWPRTRKQGSA